MIRLINLLSLMLDFPVDSCCDFDFVHYLLNYLFALLSLSWLFLHSWINSTHRYCQPIIDIVQIGLTTPKEGLFQYILMARLTKVNYVNVCKNNRLKYWRKNSQKIDLYVTLNNFLLEVIVNIASIKGHSSWLGSMLIPLILKIIQLSNRFKSYLIGLNLI